MGKKTFRGKGHTWEWGIKELSEGNMPDTQGYWDNMLTKQRRIAKAAEKHTGKSLTNVAQYIDAQWMYCAYEWTRRDGAAGIDGVTAAEYEAGLREKLENLVELLKRGT